MARNFFTSIPFLHTMLSAISLTNSLARKFLLSVISFAYTALLILSLLVSVLIFNNSSLGFTALAALFLFLVFLAGVVLLVVFQFERIRGCFFFIYPSSLLASFLMPLLISFGATNWHEVGLVLTVLNIMLGPAMVFMIAYFIAKLVKKRKNTQIQPPAYYEKSHSIIEK